MVCDADIPDLSAMVLFTDRTGEVPADRPDDELTWMELSAHAEAAGVSLLDWIVVWGRYAFSVAQFAPSPARW